MLSQRLLRCLNISKSNQYFICCQQKFYNNLPLAYDAEKDPSQYFFSPKVQKILKYLTRPDNTKIFRNRTYHGDKCLATPEYKFLTEEQLKKEYEKAEMRAEQLLQMPPVVKVHEPENRILSVDPAISGHTYNKYVFTDISLGLSSKERICVVREPDGTLRYADHDLRKKVNQIYFPLQGRSLKEPSFFSDESLFNKLLEKKEYLFILDKACMQYDPDELKYHNITAKVYQHCDSNSEYNLLRSTRHFGPFAFYLTWHNVIDALLLEMLQGGAIKECVPLVSLQRIIHQGMVEKDETAPVVEEILQTKRSYDSKRLSDQEIELIDKCIVCMDEYIAKNSTKKAHQELALQGFRELYQQRVELERGIRTAHGVN